MEAFGPNDSKGLCTCCNQEDTNMMYNFLIEKETFTEGKQSTKEEDKEFSKMEKGVQRL